MGAEIKLQDNEQWYNMPCQAPEHVEGCSGYGTTRDHFTPRCVAKLFGWSPRQIDRPSNIQYLSPACHSAKDLTTPKRLYLLRRQLLQGQTVLFGRHPK